MVSGGATTAWSLELGWLRALRWLVWSLLGWLMAGGEAGAKQAEKLGERVSESVLKSGMRKSLRCEVGNGL